jgi:hypothetical protein
MTDELIIMIRPVPTALLIILLLIPVYTQERVKKGSRTSLIGPKAVWNPSEKLASKLYSCCDKPCFATIMRKAGATEQAITFSKSIEYRGWLTSFSEMGRVDVATAYQVCMVNSNAKVLLLNGTPPLIDAEEESVSNSLDAAIDEDPLYPELVKKAGLKDAGGLVTWGGPVYEEMRPLPGGGQRFVIRFDLRRCHACDLGGHTHIGYDFDASGRFVGTRLVRLSAP